MPFQFMLTLKWM